jgi:tetratricopeptide (TPR) repeat protein
MSHGRLLVVVTLATLVGCTAIGIPVTSDPTQKLRYAYQLMDRKRFIPAEALIQESLDIYRQQGNELGMAEAYHTFGNLYKNGDYIDRYVRSTTRFGTETEAYARSIDNFTRAKVLFEKHDDYASVTRCLVGIGNGYSLLGDKPRACQSYAEALRSFDVARQKDPSVRLPILTGYPDAPSLINAFIEKEGCPRPPRAERAAHL